MFVNETAADYSGDYGQPAGWSGANCGSLHELRDSNPLPQPLVVDGHRAWRPGTYR